MSYICGDGKRFATKEKALAHASDVFTKKGFVIAVVEKPAKVKK